jgi:MFS family permease
MGLCTAPIYPASGQIIARWLPFRQRALANGLVMGAALTGIASTFLGFGALISLCNWPGAFVITGTITAILALFWTLYARNNPRDHPAVNPAEIQLIQPVDLPAPAATAIQAGAPPVSKTPAGPVWLMLLTNRSLVLLTLSYAAIGYFEYLFYFWIEFYFKQLNMDTDTSRICATVVNLSMAVGMGMGGRLSDGLLDVCGYRWGRALVPMGGMLFSAALLALGLWITEPIWIVICFALALAAAGASEGPFWATAIELGGKHGGTSAGIFNTGGNIGGVLAPIVTPFISERFGWHWGMSLGSIVCLAGLGLWFWIDPRERVTETPPAA